MSRILAFLSVLIEVCLCNESYQSHPRLLYLVSGNTIITEDFIAKYLAIPEHVPKAGARVLRYGARKGLHFLKQSPYVKAPSTSAEASIIGDRITQHFEVSPEDSDLTSLMENPEVYTKSDYKTGMIYSTFVKSIGNEIL